MTGLLKTVRIVLFKELWDGIRDRRSVMSVISGPIVTALLFSVVLKNQSSITQQSRDVKLHVYGAEYAPHLVDWLSGQVSVEVTELATDPVKAVSDGEARWVLRLDQEFADDFAAAKTAKLELIYDSSTIKDAVAVAQVRSVIGSYNRTMGDLRLIARGVAPAVSRPTRIVNIDISEPSERLNIGAMMLTLFLMISTFMGGLYLATDVTAGERERGSLEPLLVTPVSRAGIVTGKWLAVVLFTSAGLCLYFVCMAFVFQQPSDSMGPQTSQLDLGVKQSLAALAVMFSLVLPATALQLLVATFARSFKEALSYLQMMAVLPGLPSMMSMFEPIDPELWMYAVPSLSHHLLVTDVLTGNAVDPIGATITAVSCLLLAAVLLTATTGLFKRERIIFGR